jgi:hypothetical protein
MANPTYWIGQDSNIYYGSGQEGTPVQNLGNYQTGQFDARDDGLYDRYSDSGTPRLTYSASRIDDPAVGNVLGDSTFSGSTGSTTPAYNPDDMNYLQGQMSLQDRLLESMGVTRQTGMERLNQAEQSARDGATLQNDRRVRDFNTQRSDSYNSKQRALGTVNTNARTLADSLRRMLGLASGSSSSQLVASNAVARQASQQRNSVMSNYGQNERDLDTAVSDNEVDFAGILQGIVNDRKSKEQEFLQGLTTGEQGIVNSKAEIAAEMDRLRGGSGLSAMRPYQDRYMQLQNENDRLQREFTPTFTPRAGTVKTPNLRDYLVDRQSINANKQGNASVYSPYAQFLQKKEEERLA